MQGTNDRSRTVAVIVLRVVCVLTAVFSAGALGDASTPWEDRVLIASFGVGMGVFGFGLTLSGIDRRAWTALLYLPVFLAVHVSVLGVWVPDLPLALAVVWALATLRPGRVPEPLPAR